MPKYEQTVSVFRKKEASFGRKTKNFRKKCRKREKILRLVLTNAKK